MLKVEKLIVKAKEIKGIDNLGLFLSFISYDEDNKKYKLYCDLWGGKPGSGIKRLTTYHDTKEECHKEVSRIEEMYPPKYDNILIIDTTGLED